MLRYIESIDALECRRVIEPIRGTSSDCNCRYRVVSCSPPPQAAASKGDLPASKRLYVELVAELQSWSSAEGLSNKLKGLN